MSEGVTIGVTVGVTVNRSVTGRKSKRAMTVERLLHWAYGVELVRGQPSWGESEGAGIASTARGGCHGDALTIDSMVMALLPESPAALVRLNAMSGTRPDWKPNARLRFGPKVLNDVVVDGQVVRFAEWFWTHPRACGCHGWGHSCTRRDAVTWARGDKAASYCPVYQFDAPREVEAVRARFYGRWWKSLEVIRDALMQGDVLASHIALPGLPPQFPWLEKIPVDEAISSR